MDSRSHSQYQNLSWTASRKLSNASPPRRLKKSQSAQKQLPQSPTARLKELCPEDKAKIGELVKRLSTETQLRKQLEQNSMEAKYKLEKQLRRLKRQNAKIMKENKDLQQKFQQSIMLLNSYKNQNTQLIASKQKSSLNIQPVQQIYYTPQKQSYTYKSSATSPVKQDESPMRFSEVLQDKEVGQDFGQSIEENQNWSFGEEELVVDSNSAYNYQISAINEIKSLKQELSSLSKSIKNLNASVSVRNSTGEVHRSNSPGFEESPYESRSKFSNPLSIESVLKSDDRAKEVLQRAQLNSQKASKYMQYDYRVNSPSPYKDIQYNDQLFNLLDDIEFKQSYNDRPQSAKQLINVIDDLQVNHGTASPDYASDDSFEELRKRATKLRLGISLSE